MIPEQQLLHLLIAIRLGDRVSTLFNTNVTSVSISHFLFVGNTTLLNFSGPNLPFTSGATATTKESNQPFIITIISSEANGEDASGVMIIAIVTAIIVVILIILISIAIIALVLYLRKSTGHKQDDDHSYSILNRDITQQTQPSAGLYDQIQLSPFTGQAEIVSKVEIENINCTSPHQNTSLNIETKQRNIIQEQNNVSTPEQPTYAVVKKKQNMNKQKEPRQNQNSAAEEKGEKVMRCSPTTTDKIDIKYVLKNHDQIKQKEATPTFVHTTESPEALYTVVKKEPKINDNRAENEDKVPPPPSHSVEELYTAVKKNVKGGTTEEEGAPQIPRHTVEDLYTAVAKEPKADEAVPPIPPHTVEELYTAVQKGCTMEGEEDAPPIPPHTAEDC